MCATRLIVPIPSYNLIQTPMLLESQCPNFRNSDLVLPLAMAKEGRPGTIIKKCRSRSLGHMRPGVQHNSTVTIGTEKVDNKPPMPRQSLSLVYRAPNFYLTKRPPRDIMHNQNYNQGKINHKHIHIVE